MSDSPIKSPRRKSQRRSSFAASRINILHKGTSGQGRVIYTVVLTVDFAGKQNHMRSVLQNVHE